MVLGRTGCMVVSRSGDSVLELLMGDGCNGISWWNYSLGFCELCGMVGGGGGEVVKKEASLLGTCCLYVLVYSLISIAGLKNGDCFGQCSETFSYYSGLAELAVVTPGFKIEASCNQC